MFTCIICNHTCVYTIPSALPSRKTSRLNLNQALDLTSYIDQTSNIQHQHVCKHRETIVNTNTLNIIKHQSTPIKTIYHHGILTSKPTTRRPSGRSMPLKTSPKTTCFLRQLGDSHGKFYEVYGKP